MRYTRLLCGIYILIAGFSNLSAMQTVEGLLEAERYTYVPRELLIFLDKKEKGYIGPVSTELFIAFAQKAGPILASTSLLKNVFGEYGKDINDKAYRDIFGEVAGEGTREKNKILIRMAERLEEFQSPQQIDLYPEKGAAYRYILFKALNFNPHDWVIKKVSDFLYLFIPITYLFTHNIDVSKVLEDEVYEVSDTELQLGLRVNHMQTSSIEVILMHPDEKPDSHYFIDALYNDVTRASTLFCLRSDYINKHISLPAWTIFMTGHGYEGLRIAGIPRDEFKKLLHFLENKIICRLFVYDSCFSAGANIEAIYKDLKSMMQDTYSFPIIVHALTDAVVFSIVPDVAVDRSGNLTLKSYNGDSFADFFQAASNPEITDYKDVVRHIFKVGSRTNPNEAPQIKMPGLEWFSILETNQAVGIGQILAKSRDPHVPLNVKTFFRADPRIILLYTANVPFELQLNPHIKAIVSMIPGGAVHKMAKISSTVNKVDDLLRMFMKVEMLAAEKMFFIKEIQGADKSVQDVIIAYTKIPGRSEDTYLCVAYYIDNGTMYVKSSKNDKPEIGSPHNMQQHQAYMNIATHHQQREGSLLPFDIQAEGIEKIKAALEQQHSKEIHRKRKRIN